MTKHGITLQKQPDLKTCVQTCIAMVLDTPVKEVIEEYGGEPLNQEKLHNILTEKDVP